MNNNELRESVSRDYVKMRIEGGIENSPNLLSDGKDNKKISLEIINKLIEEQGDRFAEELYKVLLNRNAEISALNNIRTSLSAGRSKQDIISDVLKSDEFMNTNMAVDEDVYKYLNKYDGKKFKNILYKIRRFSRINRLKDELEEMRQKSIHQEEILHESFCKIYEILKRQGEDWRKRQEKLEEQNNGLNERQNILSEQQIGLGEQQNNVLQYYQLLCSQVDEQRRMAEELLIKINEEIELKDMLETEGILGEINIDEYIDVNTSDKNEKFYSTLGNLFRGNYNSIIEKQRNYIKYIDLSIIAENDIFSDLGCGRGEFLEILKENGIHGQGVDLNGAIIEDLQSKGLDAVQMDIYKYLEQLKDNSLAGASAFQVIEHLEFDCLRKIVQLAYKKIKTNGTLILETVNPYCIWGLGSYYIDPTHIKLYVADTMKTLLWIEGFREIKIVYYAPVTKELRTKANIFANYAGYAIIAKKYDISEGGRT